MHNVTFWSPIHELWKWHWNANGSMCPHCRSACWKLVSVSVLCFLFVMEVILICYVTVFYCPWRPQYMGEKNIFGGFFWKKNILLHLCEHVNYTVLGFIYSLIIVFLLFIFSTINLCLWLCFLQLACCKRWSCHACFAESLSHLNTIACSSLHAGVNVNEVRVMQQARLVLGCPVLSCETHMALTVCPVQDSSGVLSHNHNFFAFLWVLWFRAHSHWMLALELWSQDKIFKVLFVIWHLRFVAFSRYVFTLRPLYANVLLKVDKIHF